MVDEDYRLGRGILDDFRPTGYKSYLAQLSAISGVGLNNPSLAVSNPALVSTNPALLASNPGLVTSTPVLGSVGQSNIKDFL